MYKFRKKVVIANHAKNCCAFFACENCILPIVGSFVIIAPRFRRPCCFCRCFLNELVVVCSTVWIRKLLWRKHFVYINVATFKNCFHIHNLFTVKGFWQLKIQMSHCIFLLVSKIKSKISNLAGLILFLFFTFEC